MNGYRLSLAFAEPTVRHLRRTLFGLVGAFAAFAFVASAQAGTYSLSLDLEPGSITGNINLVTDDTGLPNGPLDILSASGTLNGLSVSLLSADNVFNDNELYIGGNLYLGSFPFDNIGLGLLTSDNVQWAIFEISNLFGAGIDGLTWCTATNRSCVIDVNKFVASVAVTPTPLPAALPLFGTGLGGLVVMLRRKRKAVAAAA